MPPCKIVLLNKVERTKYLSRSIKNAANNAIEQPEKGWIINENEFMEIDYFDGDPFPEITMDEKNYESEDDENAHISEDESDESDEYDKSDEEWQPE